MSNKKSKPILNCSDVSKWEYEYCLKYSHNLNSHKKIYRKQCVKFAQINRFQLRQDKHLFNELNIPPLTENFNQVSNDDNLDEYRRKLYRQSAFEIIAKFSYGGKWRSGGMFCAVNPRDFTVIIADYFSFDGDWSVSGISSDWGIDYTIGKNTTRVITFQKLKRIAGGHFDLLIPWRVLDPGDYDYIPLMCLYTGFQLYIKYHDSYRQFPFQHHWEFDNFVYQGIIKIQACFRGWYFRHRVLYSPHTELGRRFIMMGYKKLKNI